MAANLRFRNFACVVYPCSAEPKWLNIIEDSKLQVFISPLHDKDFNDDGKKKDDHYHVLVAYEGKKSVDQVREFFNSFGGVGCEIVGSFRGYARYLCHLDNPEKAKYNTLDVKAFGGLVYSVVIGTMADKNTAIRQMLQFIRANDVTSYSDLVDWSEEYEPSWLDCLMNSGSYFIKEYIKSRTWKLHQKSEV